MWLLHFYVISAYAIKTTTITTVEIFYKLYHTYLILEILGTTVSLNISYQRCNRICEVNKGYTEQQWYIIS